MELKEMNIEQLEARKSELLSQVETTEEREQLDAIEAEMKAIKAELEARAQAEAEKAEIRKQIANDAVAAPIIKEFKEADFMGKLIYIVCTIAILNGVALAVCAVVMAINGQLDGSAVDGFNASYNACRTVGLF